MESVQNRIDSLLGFLEARDRQLELPMGDCGRDPTGRFGDGNNCAGEGQKTAEQSQQAAADVAVATKSGNTRVLGRAGESTKNGFPSAWREPADFEHKGGVPGADKIAGVEVTEPGHVYGTALSAGIGSVSDFLRIGAATYAGSRVELVGSQHGAHLPRSDGNGYDYSSSARRTVVSSQVPVKIGGEVLGEASVEVSVTSTDDADFSSYISYGYFQVDRDVKSQIAREKGDSGTGFSRTESHIGAMIVDMMSESMATAEKSGIKAAKTMAAGFPGSSDYSGYRLWPRFGFDSKLPGSIKGRLAEAVQADPELLTATGKRELSRGSISLQRLLQTKKGERWWKQNGVQIDLTFDFTKKRSLGYKKYKRMQEIAAAARRRGSRSFHQFADVVFRSYVCEDIGRWPFLYAEYERRSDDCGTGSGGFKPGNSCGGRKSERVAEDKPLIKEIGGLRNSDGSQTRVARKVYSMGLSERKLSSMIESLGGDPKASVVKVSLNRLNIQVKSRSGGRPFFIEVRTKGARVYGLEPGKTLSKADMDSVKAIVKEAMPEKVKGKTDQDFTVTVYNDPKDYEAWKKESADRYKAIEEKYKYTPYLPPHRRPKAQSRNCGTGSGGFQKGNTCGGQAAADIAAGAVKGAASGAGLAAGKTLGFPPAVASGAAAGAAAGAVKGLYDNRMRPTRAGKAIKRIGSSDDHVSSIVKSLGGTPKSVAEADGRDAVSLDIKGPDGKSQFSVRMTKGEVSIRPSSGKMSSKQIAKIKDLAAKSAGTNYKVVVQDQPVSVLTKIIQAGFSLAVDATVGLVAGAVLPVAPAVAGTAIEATTGLDIEKTRLAKKAGEVLLGNTKKRR